MMFVALALLLSSSARAGAPETYATTCAPCHGATGAGDGDAAAALDVKPADFRDPQFWSARADEQIAKGIKEGGLAIGRSPLMAPFGAMLDDVAVAEMVAYLKSLAPTEPPPSQPAPPPTASTE